MNGNKTHSLELIWNKIVSINYYYYCRCLFIVKNKTKQKNWKLLVRYVCYNNNELLLYLHICQTLTIYIYILENISKHKEKI